MWWNEGARNFSTAGPLALNDSRWAVALADVDGDSLLDAVVGNISGDPNRLCQNLGGRAFTATQEFGDEFGLYWSTGLGLAVFGSLTALFAATTAGQRYVDLYAQHGAEMGRLGLDDPQLLWDAYGTLQNFLPGLEALVTGSGEDVVVTQARLDDAQSIGVTPPPDTLFLPLVNRP